MKLSDFKFDLFSEQTGRVKKEYVKKIDFLSGKVEIQVSESGAIKQYDLAEFEILRSPELTDENGDPVMEGDVVRQEGVVTGCDTDFTGVVKYYDGTWYVDNDDDAVELFNECCKNKVIHRKHDVVLC